MLKIGAGYIRASTDDQLEYSPDSQIRMIREYAKREGYIIPDEYIYQDDGISGKSAEKRPQFRLMVATAKETEPPWDCIFVWEYSRFARNQEESIMYKNLLRKRGIAVKSVREPLTDSPFSSLIERIIEWMDEYYLTNLAIEVRRGMAERASRGEAVSAAPYGYTMVEGKLMPSDKAELVRWIFEAYAGGGGLRDIAVELGARGVKTTRGKAPDNRWVRYVLRNPAYIGKIRWSPNGRANYVASSASLPDGHLLVDGLHEPLIDRELWDKVQARLASRADAKYLRRNGNDHMFALRGLLRCSSCGATLTYSSSKWPCVQCNKYARGQCHTSHSVTIAAATNAVISGLQSAIRDKVFKFELAAPRKEPAFDWDKLIKLELSRLDRAREAYLDGVFTAEEYSAAKAAADAAVARYRQSQEADTQAAPAFEPEAYAEKVADVLKVLTSPDVDELAKNQALRTIIDKIIFDRAANTYDIFFTR